MDIAIVDLDLVASDLGIIEYNTITIENLVTVEDSTLLTLQNNLQTQMAGVVEEAGDDPTDEQKQRIAETNRNLNIQLGQAREQATAKVNMKRTELVREFQDALRPLALNLAKQKGYSAVFCKVMPPVFAYDDSIDLSAELAVIAKEAGLAKEAPERIPKPEQTPTTVS
jgi:Skp family chaperone for outer membrane proteins